MKIRLKGDEKLILVDVRKRPQSRKPEFPYGLKLPVAIEFYHDNDSAFTEAELNIFTSFQFGIDSDFNFSTEPPVLANNSTTTFVISGNTISFEARTDTDEYKAMLNGKPSADGYAEFKAYKPGESKPTMAPVFNVLAKNAVIADGTAAPPSSPELYATSAEVNALLAEYSKTYPPNAPLVFTKADVDAGTKLLSVNHALNQKWGLGVSIDSEDLGKRLRFDEIIPVDENNLNIDCTNWYADMTGNYHLTIRK